MSTKFELIVSGSGLEPERQLEIRAAFEPFAIKLQDWSGKVAAVPVPTLSTKEAQDLAQAITAHLAKTIANMHARAAQMEDAQ